MRTVAYEIVLWEPKVCGDIQLSIIKSIVDYEIGRGNLFGIPHWMITCLLGGRWYERPDLASFTDTDDWISQCCGCCGYGASIYDHSYSNPLADLTFYSGNAYSHVGFPDFVAPLSSYLL